jgi:hypothetical protein
MGKRFVVSNKDLIRMYKSCGSISETAVMCNTSYSTVYKRLRDLDVLPMKATYYKEYIKPQVPAAKFVAISDCEGGVAIKVDQVDKVLKLKEGKKVRVKSEGRIVTRKIDKIFKHHVLTINPKGYPECFTKGEILVYNYGKKEVV